MRPTNPWDARRDVVMNPSGLADFLTGVTVPPRCSGSAKPGAGVTGAAGAAGSAGPKHRAGVMSIGSEADPNAKT
jgi:hypothetical protein